MKTDRSVQAPDLFAHGGYYIWQVAAYGTGLVFLDLPACVMKYRPMPSTPAGEVVAELATGEEALLYLRAIS